MNADQIELCRGMVLVRVRQGSNEAGIVLEPFEHPLLKGLWTVVHGYINEPTACGLFEIRPSDVPHVWRRATPEEAAKVRALFIEHATAWGPDSNGWVAKTIPADEQPDCARCNGLRGILCSECSGEGCAACEGEGDSPCPSCNSSGDLAMTTPDGCHPGTVRFRSKPAVEIDFVDH